MSRDLKFRAYDSASGKVSEPFDVKESWGDYLIDFGDYSADGALDSIIWEQFTGLTDKNGKEIYEGDIVEEDIDFNSKMTDGTFRYKVYWNEDELCWSLNHIGPESIHNDLWELNSSRRVIGNVHENKESLDGSN